MANDGSGLLGLSSPGSGLPDRDTAILWFRKGLRLHDNPALLAACGLDENGNEVDDESNKPGRSSRRHRTGFTKASEILPSDSAENDPAATNTAVNYNTAFSKAEPISDSSKNLYIAARDSTATSAIRQLCPVFVLDPWFLAPDPSAPSPGSTRVGINRIRFLLDCLKDLNSQLKARGSRLILVKGDPTVVIPKLVKQCGAKRLCFEFDTEPYALARDGKIKAVMQEAGVEVVTPVSHTVFDPAEVIRMNGGKPPLTYQAFCKRVGQPSPPVGPAPDKLPPLPPDLVGWGTLPGGRIKAETEEAAGDARNCDHIEVFEVPALSDLGYSDAEASPEEDVTPFRGGETEALCRLDDCLSRTKWVKEFEKPKGDPSALTPPATTVLSPYLKFGCLSSRLMYARIQEVLARVPGHTKPPVSLLGQLLWREFFYTASFGTPNFDRMQGSAICRQIPWKEDSELLAAWRDARTGFPWIDAIMVQLQQWGWMHHLARHCVACFLTRGDLLVHWELGRDVFDRLLIDSDWAINNGNWLWLSASAFFSQYHRIYSPITFGKKYDPSGKFVRHFLPVLKDMPAQYIYEPWTAPLAVQRRAKCILGKDYPLPIVDHAEASKRCRDVMGTAYAANRLAANAGAVGNRSATATSTASRGSVSTAPGRVGGHRAVPEMAAIEGDRPTNRTRRAGSTGEGERGEGKLGVTKKKQKMIDDIFHGKKAHKDD
ncbi:hypothetical protein CLOM_g22285 [Closterium sp. NIES-68]|nr:hypothetical protein CLOM_g22285 [Closterium sp. NIES-68]GJP64442.1 hypothetical protein CLOP_g21433 [Closterium sp. NIES-67]